jgi:transposase
MMTLEKRRLAGALRAAGMCQEMVARKLEVSVRTVRRLEAHGEREEDPVVADFEVSGRRVGRPSQAAGWCELVGKLLDAEPGLKTVELLRRARLDGYGGGKSPFYEMVSQVRGSRRPAAGAPLIRFETFPGECSQHDFGEARVHYIDGRTERVHFFASRLKYSRWTEVSLVDDQRVESLVRSLVDHLAAMGGIPLMAVFDRPKTIALSWGRDGKVIRWNRVFESVIRDLNIVPELCWPYSPRQKGSVENLVGWVKGSFFTQRKFIDRADVASQLAAWLVEVNTVRASRATGVPPSERIGRERERLRPLAVAPADFALRIAVVVGPTATVRHEGAVYSMPPDSISVAATLYLQRDRVRIVAGRHEALHPRLFLAGQKSMLPDHRAQNVAAVSGKRAKRYCKRQQLMDLGEQAFEYLDELCGRRNLRWHGDVDRLFDLLEKHGESAMRGAFRAGLERRLFGTEYIEHFLRAARGLPPPDGPTPILQQELFS